MIVYGAKATQTANEKIKIKCSHCQTEDSIRMYVHQKYVHLFWIPFIPINKVVLTECSHCKQVLKENEFNFELKQHCQRIKTNAKIPKWTFIGIAIFVFWMFLWSFNIQKDNKEELERIKNPIAGDVYEIFKDNLYTTYKVDYVSNDTIYVFFNLIQSKDIKGLGKIQSFGNKSYSKEHISISQKELLEKYKAREIISVVRK